MLGNDEPIASVVGEIVASREFYDYRAKYLDNGSRSIIPADITGDARRPSGAWRWTRSSPLDGAGLARVDFFLDQAARTQLYLNEVNTMPGFTRISMYPKLWEASGIPFPELLDRLIQLGLERYAEKQAIRTHYTPDDAE